MGYEPQAHQAQAVILRHMLFAPQANFAQLRKATNLTSDHCTFHIKQLVREEYLEKAEGGYRLSPKGKEYANRMDTDQNRIEKQPKVSIAITLERRGENGEREFLYQQRLKNPFYGFWGRIGGKIRWGESVLEAANRELKEETGLTAEFEFKVLYHKRDYDKVSKQLLEDKLFHCVHSRKFDGELIESFEGGFNRWMTEEEFMSQPKRFSNVQEVRQMIDKGQTFVEREFYYDESEY